MFICRKPRAGKRAFTLIEVIIGITILAMITGTLFAIIRGSVRAAADIESVQRENDSINRLVELFRQTFQTMPGTATLSLATIEGTLQELTITGAPHCFGFGKNRTSYKDSIFSLQPDLKQPTSKENDLPRYDLSLSREDMIPPTSDDENATTDVNTLVAPDEQGRYWMPLLPGVTGLTWRFYKQENEEWLEDWSDTKWPDLIEMNLTMDGRTLPMRVVFGVPVIAIRAATGGSSGGTPRPTSTSSTAPAPGGGGGAPTGGGPPAGGGAPR